MTTLFVFEIPGSVVDVGKLLTQLKRSETARSDTESQLKSACKSVQELKDASEKHASVKDKLQVSFDFVILRLTHYSFNYCFFHPIFGFLSLLATQLRIFVYILQGKMGKT